jgi:phage gp16-like protein
MLFKLLGLPFTLPVAGIKFCLQQVVNTAERELYDDEPVKEQLLLLALKLEEGEISEEEYAEQEAILHRRLREIRQYREEKMRAALAAHVAHAAQSGQEEQAHTANPRGARIEITADAGDIPPR